MSEQETMAQFSALLEAYENVVLAWTTKDGNTEILPARDALRDFVVALAAATSTAPPVVDERPAFEKGLSARYVAPDLTRDGESYEDFDIRGAWTIYKAARLAAGAAPLIDYKSMYETAERLRVANYETMRRMQAERDALLAPSDALPAAWQPIETAPKDVLVVVYTPPKAGDHPDAYSVDFDHLESDGDEAFWFQHHEHYEHSCCIAKPDGCIGPSAEAPYTHWTPLPAAPVAAVNKENNNV